MRLPLARLMLSALIIGVVSPSTFGAPKKTAARTHTAPVTAALPSGADWASFDFATGDQLQIEGLRGDVTVTFVDAGPRLSVRVKQNGGVQNQLVTREGKQIVVRTPTQLSTADWEKVAGNQIQPVAFQVEVVAGPIPMAVTWREGSVKVTGAKQPFSVSGLKGSLNLEDNTANGKVEWMEGAIQASRHHGALTLITNTASIDLVDTDGNIQITSHVGKTKLSGIQGDLKYTSYHGSLSGEDIRAGMEIQSGQASINLKNVAGAVHGQNQDGETVLQLAAKSGLRFETTKGDVRVRLAKGIGARVNLTSEGRILTPPSIRVNAEGLKRSASGRVEGETPVTISVRSKSGQVAVGI